MTQAAARRWRTALVGALVLGVLTLCGAGAYWHHQGGRWYDVSSPSMGTNMPTGSLVLTRPTTMADVHVGEVITFYSPGSHLVFSHRVVAVGPEGLTTRGDVNESDDAWTITDKQLIGRVAWRAPILGWVLRAMPLLILGMAITWLLSLLARESRRGALRILGASATVSIVSWILHPWVGLEQISQTAPADGSQGILMKVISTGLLPIRATEVNGHTAAGLHNGQVSTLHLTHLSHGGFNVDAHLDLEWWGWALLVLVVLTPMLWSLIWGLPPLPLPGAHAAGDDGHPDTPQTKPALDTATTPLEAMLR